MGKPALTRRMCRAIQQVSRKRSRQYRPGEFIETLALPSGVLAPVECSHGRHVRINSACLARCSGVHFLAAIFNL